MNAQHTPGPWFTEATSTIGHHYIVDSEGFTIATPSPMGQANARLIAAAPELLSALRQLMEYTGGWNSPPDHPCGIARDALTKATGEQF